PRRQARGAPADAGGDQRKQERERDQPQRPVRDTDAADEDRGGREEAGVVPRRSRALVGRRAHVRTVGRRVRAYVRVGRPCGPGRRGPLRACQADGGLSSDATVDATGFSGWGSALTAQYTTQQR